MSVKVMTWVFESSRSKKNARLVLLAIADCANDEGRQAYPSMAKLMQKTGLGDRAVTTLVGDLEKLGELIVSRNAGPRGCNLYEVVMTPADSAGTPAGNAPPQNMHPRRKQQAPPQETTGTPAGSAPGTIKEPSKNHPLKTNPDADALPFDALIEPEPDAKAKRGGKREPLGDPTEDQQFMTWWRAYPNAVKRPDTYRCWLKATKKITPDRLHQLTVAYAMAYKASGKETRFIPMSTTWLNQEQWNDPLPASRMGSNGHQSYRNPEDPSIYEGDL